jgi:hypothetical protein
MHISGRSVGHPSISDRIQPAESYERLGGYLLIVNLISFFVLSLTAFRGNERYLFYGLDGRFEVSLITLNSLFVPPLLGYTSDFFHGLGNVWFTINPRFIPGYLLSLSAPGEFTNFPLAYAVCATELFGATFLAGRLVSVPPLASLLAGWLLPLLCFQYAGWNLVPTTFRAFPHYATVASVTTVVGALLLRIAVSKPTNASLLGVICFLAISYIVIASPTLLILGAPFLAICGIVSVLGAGDRQSAARGLAVMTVVVIACIVVGHATFILGLTSYSAASFFRNLSIRPPFLWEASMLFWEPLWPNFFTIERSFVLLGLCGGIWSIVGGKGPLRLAAIAFVATSSIYLVLGVAHAYQPFWFGPAFWYFEGFLFPYHGLFAVIALGALARMARVLVFGETPFRWRSDAPSLALLGIIVAALPWACVGYRKITVGPPDLPFYSPHPQHETAITRILRDEIALKPGDLFRGREATMTGRIFSRSRSVDATGLAGVADFLAMYATGNTHSAAALWQDRIPTLLEYNPLMTPAYYVFGRTFFTEPVDRQIRNLLAMRLIDPRILAAVGVRFVITDAPFAGEARLRQSIDILVDRGTPVISGREPISSFKLYLYELDRVNVGQFSPTEQRRFPKASEMLDVLADSAVDLARVFVTSESVRNIPLLTPAGSSEFRIEKGSYSVKSTSEGWSVLILPLEYSRCIGVEARGAHSRSVRLFRADFLLTGVLFEQEIDARLTYHTGPFREPSCRLADAREVNEIDIRNAFERRPDLAPTPVQRY